MTTPKNILVATDLRDASADAMEDAFELAVRVGAMVHVVHALQLKGVQEMAPLTDEALEQGEAAARAALFGLAERFRPSGQLGQLVVERGEIVTTILRAASELGVDLVVVGSHNRRGITRMLLGSVAESVVRHAPCGVLIVRRSEA